MFRAYVNDILPLAVLAEQFQIPLGSSYFLTKVLETAQNKYHCSYQCGGDSN